MEEATGKRDYAIDALRMIGLFCIILAHVKPNGILFDLRNFDVVCMVIVMAMSYYITSHNKDGEMYFSYIGKRIKRLLIPTWTFLTLFFAVFFLLGRVNDRIHFDVSMIKTSYLLISGIGYVWIIRVYLLIALISPLIKCISESIKSDKAYIIFLLGWYFIYEYFVMKSGDWSSKFFVLNELTGGDFYLNICLFLMGFGLIAALGYRYKEFSKKERFAIIFAAFICYAGFIIKNGYVSTQEFKYPPRLYYISYGIMVSLILYEILSLRVMDKVVNNKIVAWFSKNSLWLYLWHIIPVKILEYYDLGRIIETKLIVRYMFCVVGAVILTLAQNWVKKIIKRVIKREDNFV